MLKRGKNSSGGVKYSKIGRYEAIYLIKSSICRVCCKCHLSRFQKGNDFGGGAMCLYYTIVWQFSQY